MADKGQHLAELNNIQFKLYELEYMKDELHANYMQPVLVPREPINIRWQLNTAIAGVLGLMFAVFITFLRPHFSEFATHIRDKAPVK